MNSEMDVSYMNGLQYKFNAKLYKFSILCICHEYKFHIMHHSHSIPMEQVKPHKSRVLKKIQYSQVIHSYHVSTQTRIQVIPCKLIQFH